MTDKLIGAARVLKEFCDLRLCNCYDCAFSNNEGDCFIGYPPCWIIPTDEKEE